MTLIYTVILLLISLTSWCGLNVWEVWCYSVFLDHQLLVNLERHSSPHIHHTPTHSQTHLQLHMRAMSFLFTVNSDICPKWRLATPLLHNWQNCKANLCSLPHCSLQISPRLLLYSAPNLALVCPSTDTLGVIYGESEQCETREGGKIIRNLSVLSSWTCRAWSHRENIQTVIKLVENDAHSKRFREKSL